MIQRMETYDRLAPVEEKNELNEKEITWERVGAVRAAISTANGQTQALNELWRVESSHTALTHDAVKVGERLRDARATYEVVFIIPGTWRRMHQLFLKQVTAREAMADDTGHV